MTQKQHYPSGTKHHNFIDFLARCQAASHRNIKQIVASVTFVAGTLAFAPLLEEKQTRGGSVGDYFGTRGGNFAAMYVRGASAHENQYRARRSGYAFHLMSDATGVDWASCADRVLPRAIPATKMPTITRIIAPLCREVGTIHFNCLSNNSRSRWFMKMSHSGSPNTGAAYCDERREAALHLTREAEAWPKHLRFQ